jgi:DNA-binding protein HU-beta
MNKADLVGKMAESAGITKAAAESALSGVLEAIAQVLKSGERVSVAGFGTFSVAQREEREGRNPATGKKIRIPAKKVVRFKPGSKLADQVQK